MIMNRIRTERHVDQLRKRREQIAMTLRHLGRERAELERNTEWVSRDVYERRARFLSGIHSWYVTEIDQIDQALTRPEGSNYGLCTACDEPIEEPRLNAVPESTLCHACAPHKDHEVEL
jgi:RNA polymerase-binding transcription factor DksA